MKPDNSIKSNQLKAGVVLSYLHTGIGMLVSLLYTPFVLRVLGQSENGVYQTAASVISYLNLLSLGFGSSYMRFFSRYRSKNDEEGIKKLNGLFILVFGLAAVLSLVAGLVLSSAPTAVFGNKFTAGESALAQKLLIMMSVGMAITFVDSVFNMYVTAHERFVFQNVIGIAGTVLNPMLALPLLLLGYGASGLTFVAVIVNAFRLAVDIFYARRLGMKFSLRSPDISLFKEIAVFSLFILLSSVAGQINSTVDKFLLARYIGSASVSVYDVGAKFNTYLMMFSVTVSNVFIPRVNNYVAEKRSNVELTELMTRVGRIQFYIMALVFGGFVLVGRYFIGIYAGDGYGQSYSIALYLMGASLIPYCQNIGVEIQNAENKHIFRSVAYLVIALCNIAVSIPLIRSMGISGAALGSALALIVGNVIIMNIYYKKGIGLDMNSFWRSLLRPIASAVIAFVPCFTLAHFWRVDRMGRFITVGAMYVVLFAASAWFIGADNYERHLAFGVFQKIDVKRKRVRNEE